MADFNTDTGVNWDDANTAWQENKNVTGGGIIPPGTYVAKVDKLWPDTSNASSLPVVRCRFRIVSAIGADMRNEDPTLYRGQTVLLTLSLTYDKKRDPTAFSLTRTRQLEAAVGFVKNTGTLQDLVELATGQLVRIELSVREWQGNDRNNVDKISPATPADTGGFDALPETHDENDIPF